MNLHRIRSRSFPLLALALSSLASGSTAQADTKVSYIVNVDTTGIGGLPGYVDFQFNPNDAAALPATALVTGFQTDATDISLFYTDGDVSGAPETGLFFDNGQPINEWTDQLTFGTYASFEVTLSASAVGGSGSAFYLTLFDVDGDFYSTGPVTVMIAIDPDGRTSGTAFDPVDGVSPTATVTQIPIPVPEPSTPLLLAFALATLLGCDRKRRRIQV